MKTNYYPRLEVSRLSVAIQLSSFNEPTWVSEKQIFSKIGCLEKDIFALSVSEEKLYEQT